MSASSRRCCVGYVLRVCYFLLLAVTSSSGSSLRLGPGVLGASALGSAVASRPPMDVSTLGSVAAGVADATVGRAQGSGRTPGCYC